MKNELYRGISKEKFERDGRLLKPNIVGPFESTFSLDDGHCLDEGLTLDSSVNNSVVKHQKDSGKYPTSGISTTPLYERAKHYASHAGRKNGLIFVIDRNLFSEYNVDEFVVSDFVPIPNVPEDKEVILFTKDGRELLEEIIIRVEEIYV